MPAAARVNVDVVDVVVVDDVVDVDVDVDDVVDIVVVDDAVDVVVDEDFVVDVVDVDVDIVVLLLILVVRECLQLLVSMKRYILSVENWIEITMLGKEGFSVKLSLS